MRFSTTTIIAPTLSLALSLTALPVLAQSTSRPTIWQVFTVENMATALLHSAMSWARLLADIRYDQISVDPFALRLTLTGISIAPFLPHVAAGACTITVERLTMNGNALDKIDLTGVRLALDGVSVPSTCLPVEQGGMMRGFGYNALNIPWVEAQLKYNYPSGSADIRLTAEVENLVSVNASIDLDYVSYRMDFATEQPVFAVDLTQATISIDDAGGWDLAKKLLPPNMLEPEAMAQLVSGGLTEGLTEANQGAIDLSARQVAFVSQAAALASGFDAGPRRIVLATQIKGGPLHLDEAAVTSFRSLFDGLDPTIMSFAPTLNNSISTAELAAAFDAETPPENAFELGHALITGVGAPLNISGGLRFLLPLARKGNTEASFLIAQAVAGSQPIDAYGHVLRAAAADLPGALALMDRIERVVPYADIIEAQNKLLAGTDDTLFGDLSAMRRAARGYLTGTSRSRSWRAAYYWASMAAATGDATGAALRDEINEVMRLRGNAEVWALETKSLDNGVLRDWMAHDVPSLLR